MTNNTKLTRQDYSVLLLQMWNTTNCFLFYTILEIGCFSTNIMPDHT